MELVRHHTSASHVKQFKISKGSTQLAGACVVQWWQVAGSYTIEIKKM